MITNSEYLLRMLNDTIETGDIAYRANYDAVTSFDIERNLKKGLSQLKTVRMGIDRFIPLLKGVVNATREINRRVPLILRK